MRDCPGQRGLPLAVKGMFKKSVQQGRSPCDARSVPLVLREHGTRARTPLVGFFQHSLDGENGRQYSFRFTRRLNVQEYDSSPRLLRPR